MSVNMEFQYYYGEEADLFTFYRIPKILIVDNRFKGISSDAKILYGIMLDRMSLSMKNGWVDSDNRVYIYFSVEDTMEYLNVGKNKALKTLAELDSENGLGLIERVRQGQGKVTKVYVKKYIQESKSVSSSDSEVYYSNLQKFTFQNSRSPECKPLVVYKTTPNYTDNSNTENNDTYLIQSDGSMIDYERIIHENLQMDLLLKRNPKDGDLIREIVALILECVVSQSETMVIASNKYPAKFVRDKFLKLTLEHVEYVLNCFIHNTTKVKNIKKYMLAALFNAPTTIEGYYRAEVNHDMPGYIVTRQEA